jgi:hypothetical protein
VKEKAMFSIRRSFCAGLLLGLASVATKSLAVRVGTGPPPAPEAVRRSAQAPAAVQADESSSLRQGLVTQVEPQASRVQVQGVWLQAVAGRTVVIRDGRAVPFDVLRKGQIVKYTLAAGAPSSSPATLGAVYVP